MSLRALNGMSLIVCSSWPNRLPNQKFSLGIGSGAVIRQDDCDSTRIPVHIFEAISEIRDFMRLQRNKNLRLGFVPTMGALHDGHLSLVDIAQKTSDGVIISIL